MTRDLLKEAFGAMQHNRHHGRQIGVTEPAVCFRPSRGTSLLKLEIPPCIRNAFVIRGGVSSLSPEEED